MAAAPVSDWSASDRAPETRAPREYRAYRRPSRVASAAQVLALLAASAILSGVVVAAVLIGLLDVFAAVGR